MPPSLFHLATSHSDVPLPDTPNTAAPPEKKSTNATFSALGAPFGGAAAAPNAIAPAANAPRTNAGILNFEICRMTDLPFRRAPRGRVLPSSLTDAVAYRDSRPFADGLSETGWNGSTMESGSEAPGKGSGVAVSIEFLRLMTGAACSGEGGEADSSRIFPALETARSR